MATVANNDLVDGLSGRLGSSLVFRTLHGKTFVTTPARKLDKRKESMAQRSTRVSFREATQWAQRILLDPERKAYYSKRAKALKLPNAYTAALTDYMRKPKLTMVNSYENTVTCSVNKKDFLLKKVEVVINNTEGEIRTIVSGGGRWIFKLAKEEVNAMNYVRVTDETDRETIIYF